MREGASPNLWGAAGGTRGICRIWNCANAIISADAGIDTTFLPLPDIRAAIDRCGKEKILFGSDAPILNGRYDTALSEIRAMLTAAEAECLFSRNALRLFGREPI